MTPRRASTSRQPAGIPVGGQFAAKTHTEADLSLDVADTSSPTPLGFDGDLVLRVARSVADRRRMSRAMRDEIVGETAHQVTKTFANGEKAGTTVDLSKNYVAGVAQHVVAKLTTQEQQSADRWAIGEYHRLLAASEQAERRMLTPSEEDELAESVRAQQQPRHRASPGFHRRNHTPVPLRRVDVLHLADGWQPGGRDFPEGSLGDRLLVEVSEGGDRRAATLGAWDALADLSGAPPVRRGTYRGRGYEVAHTAVREAGGARAVAQAWRDDLPVDGDAERRLFEPFGAESFDERAAVVEAILRAGDYGDDLWRSAARASSDGQPPTLVA